MKQQDHPVHRDQRIASLRLRGESVATIIEAAYDAGSAAGSSRASTMFAGGIIVFVVLSIAADWLWLAY